MLNKFCLNYLLKCPNADAFLADSGDSSKLMKQKNQCYEDQDKEFFLQDGRHLHEHRVQMMMHPR